VRLNPDVPIELDHIILKGLEKDRNLRYQAAAEMRADLRRLQRDSDTKPSAVLSERPSETVHSKEVAQVQEAAHRHRSRPWKIVVVAGGIVIAGTVGVLFYSHRTTALTEKDSILLADFDNKTGDAVFDDALKQGLAVHLDQSPFLNVLSDERAN
jgi:eukaryotic-like serine/threonine-protein kinase